MLVFLAVATFGAWWILGLDTRLEPYDVGGQTPLECYLVLEYVLR